MLTYLGFKSTVRKTGHVIVTDKDWKLIWINELWLFLVCTLSLSHYFADLSYSHPCRDQIKPNIQNITEDKHGSNARGSYQNLSSLHMSVIIYDLLPPEVRERELKDVMSAFLWTPWGAEMLLKTVWCGQCLWILPHSTSSHLNTACVCACSRPSFNPSIYATTGIT